MGFTVSCIEKYKKMCEGKKVSGAVVEMCDRFTNLEVLICSLSSVSQSRLSRSSLLFKVGYVFFVKLL